jgi:hypothetical protein
MDGGWRILLLRADDEQGPVWEVDGIGPHDIYRRLTRWRQGCGPLAASLYRALSFGRPGQGIARQPIGVKTPTRSKG